MKIATSYFYQIRNFKRNMIPVSTCISDPEWYRPEPGQEYFRDKRGVINGLRYEPLIVQPCGLCPCPYQGKGLPHCDFLREYRKALYEQVDKEKTLKAFEHCADKLALPFDDEPIIVLMVYEAWYNPCSERIALQEFFNCKELEYPIK